MNAVALALMVLVVLDPVVASVAASTLAPTGTRATTRVTTVGAAVAVAAVLLGTAVLAADAVLDWLDVSAPAALLAAGIVVLVPAVEQLWHGPAGRVERAPGASAVRVGVFPLGVPVVAGPAALVALVAWSAAEGVSTTLTALVLALAALAAVALAWRVPPTGHAARVAGRFAGAAGALVAFDLIRDGVFTT